MPIFHGPEVVLLLTTNDLLLTLAGMAVVPVAGVSQDANSRFQTLRENLGGSGTKRIEARRRVLF